jgi:hypothetical protein
MQERGISQMTEERTVRVLGWILGTAVVVFLGLNGLALANFH